MISRLSIEALALVRGERPLFQGFTLEVEAGQAVALTGANGAGKTSLLRAVAGLLRPAAGRIAFHGAAGEIEPDEARATGLHLLGHHDGLKPGRTAGEELGFWTRWLGGDAEGQARAVRALELTPLLELEVRKLSAGQRRRLALARLAAAPRRLWLLDEPLAPLDAARRTGFGELMRAHLDQGGMVLAAVHDPLPIPARAVAVGGGVSALSALFRRELALAWGRGGGPLFAGAFYVGLSTLLPLAEGPSPQRLAAVAPGAAFAALALSSLLSLERLFERDYEDGALDLLSLGDASLELVAAVKCLAQWLANGAPLAALAPIVAIALGAPPALAGLTVLTALLGGLGFAFVGGIGAALALGARRGGVLVAVIVLPLFAPLVIFGAGSVTALASGLDWRSGLLFLTAYSLAAAALAPFAMAAACRNALS